VRVEEPTKDESVPFVATELVVVPFDWPPDPPPPTVIEIVEVDAEVV
jgi:hypothetical protein